MSAESFSSIFQAFPNLEVLKYQALGQPNDGPEPPNSHTHTEITPAEVESIIIKANPRLRILLMDMTEVWSDHTQEDAEAISNLEETFRNMRLLHGIFFKSWPDE